MSTALFVTLVIAVWVAAGVTAVVVFLGRSGYRDWHWYLVGAILGPIFVPIAAERARKDSRTLERTVTGKGETSGNGLTVLVASDGSPEADQAVRDAIRLTAGRPGRLILASVVDAEAGKAEEDKEAARALLAERAEWVADGGPTPIIEIGSGKPSTVLLDFAESENADFIVAGRRGKGLSRRLLGSVADELVKRSPRPVLLASPPVADQR
ncbi:hypothetical protein GCM10009716_09980 [Streptomyces sodiiphilus]|uniref:UspA domain-containing protein n=1 Tax=Streptomyces sodiiphilus TaxID=226217 RepID=A0ABN2NU33_9ACTN